MKVEAMPSKLSPASPFHLSPPAQGTLVSLLPNIAETLLLFSLRSIGPIEFGISYAFSGIF